ncbi:MAG: hypothetical protein RLZZ292_375 [Bacteroidota bacterium]|jgi:hypothetical protein
MSIKEHYQQLCEKEPIPIFMQDWWLDVVCGKNNWKPILALDKKGQILGAMTYYCTKKWGVSLITQPLLTPFSGIWMRPYPKPDDTANLYSYQVKITNELIEQILTTTFYQQNMMPSFQNWLPFHWAGYRQTTRYTYVFENTNDLDKIKEGFRSSVRKNINKALRNITITESNDLERFYEINQCSFKKKLGYMPYSLAMLKQLDQQLLQKKARKLYFAQDSEGNLHSAGYFIYDTQTMYFLASGMNINFKTSSITAIVWKALEDAKDLGICFDFEGSMLSEVAEFNQAFGATLKPYFRIYKAQNRFWSIVSTVFGK